MKNKKHPIICFEGVDGSGKTTLSKLLAKKLKGVYIKSPPESIAKTRGLIKNANDDITFHHYVFGNSAAGLLAYDMSKYKPVCLDRYHYSTRISFDRILKKGVDLPKLPKEDLLVFLWADWDIIENRLNKRGDRKPHENINNLKIIHNKYIKLLKKHKNILIINTGNNSIQESINIILSYISN